jgi:hypothetical protein
MPIIVDLRDDIKQYIEIHGLSKKWEKAKNLFENNPSHPSQFHSEEVCVHDLSSEPRPKLLF